MPSIDGITNNTPTENGGDNTPDLTTTLNNAQMGYLNSVNPTGQSNTPSIEDFHPIIPDNLSPEDQTLFRQQNFNEHNPAISPLPVSEYYPGIGEPIAKGNYSGPHIGSTTLFAPSGGYMPYGVVDSRERAIQHAADQKAAQIQNFYNQFKAPVTKHSVVQNQIDEGFHSQLQQEILPYLKKKYGQNWTKGAMTDPHVQGWVRNWNTLKDQEDFMTHRVATLEKEVQTGNFVATPELQQKLKEFYTDAKGLTEGAANPTGKRFSDTVLGFNNEYELNKVLNESVKELANLPEVQQKFPGVTDKGDFSLITSAVKESIPDDRLRVAAQNIKEQHYPNSPGMTEDKIFNGLRAIVGSGKKTLKISTVSKPHQGEGESQNYEGAVPQTGVKLNMSTANNPNSELYLEKAFNTSAYDGGKEITLALHKNMQDVQGSNIQSGKGFVSGKVQTIGLLPYNKADQKFYTAAQVEELKKAGAMQNNHNIEYRVGAVFNVTPTADNKGTVEGQNTLIVPIGDIKGKFRNSKKRPGQQDFEDKAAELENEATQLNKKPVVQPKKKTAADYGL